MADEQQWPSNLSEQARKADGSVLGVDTAVEGIEMFTETVQSQGSVAGVSGMSERAEEQTEAYAEFEGETKNSTDFSASGASNIFTLSGNSVDAGVRSAVGVNRMGVDVDMVEERYQF